MNKNWSKWAGALGLTLAGFGAAWLGIKRSEQGITRRYFNLAGGNEEEGGIAGLAFEPEQATAETPAMIVAHGFSGSKELMQNIGLEIARRGVRAYLFDFPGHGSAPVPLVPPKGQDFSAVLNTNTFQVERIYNYIRHDLPKAAIGVLGHSMGSAAIANFATNHPELKATIPVSPVGTPEFSPTIPKNLLVLVGQRDIPFSLDSSRQLFARATGKATPAQDTDTLIGDFKRGTARRFKVLKGLDHISILFAPSTMREISEWLGQSFGTDGPQQSVTIARLRWTGAGIATALAAFFPFSRLLTDILTKPPAKAATLTDRPRFADHAGAIALVLGSQFASAVILNKVTLPKFVRLQLGDYVASFFGLSGLITWAGLGIFGRGRLKLAQSSRAAQSDLGQKTMAWGVLPICLWAFVYATLGRFSHRTWNSFALTPTRARSMALITASMLPYFLADEFVFRRVGGWRGYGLSLLGKVGAVAALGLAVKLKPELGFLLILLPIMVLTFALFGLCSVWQYQQGHDFVTTGLFQTLIFAWMVSTLFPVI